MPSNLEQARKYAHAASLIGELTEKLLVNGFSISDDGDRVFLKSVTTLQEIALDISIAADDKVNENS